MDHSPGFLKLVNEAKAGIQEITSRIWFIPNEVSYSAGTLDIKASLTPVYIGVREL